MSWVCDMQQIGMITLLGDCIGIPANLLIYGFGRLCATYMSSCVKCDTARNGGNVTDTVLLRSLEIPDHLWTSWIIITKIIHC